MLLRRDDGHEIDTDRRRLDVPEVHRWLSTDAYWALGRSAGAVAMSVANSTCYGVYEPAGRQVGFARVVTDDATYAWVCDVYIDRASRGLGLGTWLARAIVADLRERGVVRIVLATADAHEVYRRAGFVEIAKPANWMELPASGASQRAPASEERTLGAGTGDTDQRPARDLPGTAGG